MNSASVLARLNRRSSKPRATATSSRSVLSPSFSEMLGQAGTIHGRSQEVLLQASSRCQALAAVDAAVVRSFLGDVLALTIQTSALAAAGVGQIGDSLHTIARTISSPYT